MSDLDKQIDRQLRITLLLVLIVVGIGGVWGLGTQLNIKTYQCTVTGQVSTNFFGGHFYSASCIGGTQFSNVGTTLKCIRVGDNVTITTSNGWYPDNISAGDHC